MHALLKSGGKTGAYHGTDFTAASISWGRWLDDRLIERLWRSCKYEDVYLRAYEPKPGIARVLLRSGCAVSSLAVTVEGLSES